MEKNLFFEQADNGMIVRDDDHVVVYENTYDKGSNSADNIAHQLGMIAYAELQAAMNELLSNKLEVRIEIKEALK